MSTINLEVGQIYATSTGSAAIQLTSVGSTRCEYIWLPDGRYETGSPKPLGTSRPYLEGCLKNYNLKSSWPVAGLPCEDCRAFCKQQCQIKKS